MSRLLRVLSLDGDSLAVVDGKCVEYLFPAVDPSGQVLPVRAPGDGGQVEDFEGCLVGREVASVTDRAAEPGVERLDRVGRVDDVAELLGELEERYELGPRPFPRQDHGRVLVGPFGRELRETSLSGRDGRCRVDGPQPFRDLAPVLLRRVPQRVAHEVHHACLHGDLGPHGPDGFGQALEAIAARYEHVGDATVAELGEHRHPLLRAFAAGRSEPQPKHVALAVHVDPDGHVHGPVRDLRVTDFHDDGIDQHDRVHLVEGPVLPGGHLFDDGVGDPADRVAADLGPVDLDQMSLDLTGRQALGIQRQHVGVEAVEPPDMLRNGDRFERRVAVPRDLELDVADLRRDRLGRVAVPRVAAPTTGRVVTLIAKMLGQLDLHAGLEHGAQQRGQQPVSADQVNPLGPRPGDQGLGPLAHRRIRRRNQLHALRCCLRSHDQNPFRDPAPCRGPSGPTTYTKSLTLPGPCDLGQSDVVYGTEGNDTIVGTEGPDTICSFGGDDVIDGRGGDDRIFAGFGNDTVTAGPGNDSVYGEAGNDQLDGGAGNDSLAGGQGDDRVIGGLGDDALGGNDGSDVLIGDDGNDHLDGGIGNDNLQGGAGNDKLTGSDGVDDGDGGLGSNICQSLEQQQNCRPPVAADPMGPLTAADDQEIYSSVSRLDASVTPINFEQAGARIVVKASSPIRYSELSILKRPDLELGLDAFLASSVFDITTGSDASVTAVDITLPTPNATSADGFGLFSYDEAHGIWEKEDDSLILDPVRKTMTGSVTHLSRWAIFDINGYEGYLAAAAKWLATACDQTKFDVVLDTSGSRSDPAVSNAQITAYLFSRVRVRQVVTASDQQRILDTSSWVGKTSAQIEQFAAETNEAFGSTRVAQGISVARPVGPSLSTNMVVVTDLHGFIEERSLLIEQIKQRFPLASNGAVFVNVLIVGRPEEFGQGVETAIGATDFYDRAGARVSVVSNFSTLERTAFDDTDRDGWRDCEEQRGIVSPFGNNASKINNIAGLFSTTPTSNDSDGDGLLDGEELVRQVLSEPTTTTKPELRKLYEAGYRVIAKFVTNPLKPDSDGDLLPDYQEVKPIVINAGRPDFDLPAGGEQATVQTDPLKSDTDGDGLYDGEEVFNGSNPLKKSQAIVPHFDKLVVWTHGFMDFSNQMIEVNSRNGAEAPFKPKYVFMQDTFIDVDALVKSGRGVLGEVDQFYHCIRPADLCAAVQTAARERGDASDGGLEAQLVAGMIIGQDVYRPEGLYGAPYDSWYHTDRYLRRELAVQTAQLAIEVEPARKRTPQRKAQLTDIARKVVVESPGLVVALRRDQVAEQLAKVKEKWTTPLPPQADPIPGVEVPNPVEEALLAGEVSGFIYSVDTVNSLAVAQGVAAVFGLFSMWYGRAIETGKLVQALQQGVVSFLDPTLNEMNVQLSNLQLAPLSDTEETSIRDKLKQKCSEWETRVASSANGTKGCFEMYIYLPGASRFGVGSKLPVSMRAATKHREDYTDQIVGNIFNGNEFPMAPVQHYRPGSTTAAFLQKEGINRRDWYGQPPNSRCGPQIAGAGVNQYACDEYPNYAMSLAGSEAFRIPGIPKPVVSLRWVKSAENSAEGRAYLQFIKWSKLNVRYVAEYPPGSVEERFLLFWERPNIAFFEYPTTGSPFSFGIKLSARPEVTVL